MLSTVAALVWAIAELPRPAALVTYLNIFAGALTPCALFAIGLGMSLEDARANVTAAVVLTVVKLIVLPLIVYGLCVSSGLDPLYTIAAVVCAAA